MGLELSASTVCLCLLRAGLVACMLLLWLPLSRNHEASDCSGHMNVSGVLNDKDVMFMDESLCNLSYNDGYIHVQRHSRNHVCC